MIARSFFIIVFCAAAWFGSVTLLAEIARPTSSLLDNDPDLVYTTEFAAGPIELLVVKPGNVFSDKDGGRKRGVLKLETKVELLAFNEEVYKIRGTLSNGTGVSGWVSPLALASRDKDFVEKFKKLYERQVMVRELISKGEIAIGMSAGEVRQVLGEPTKSTMRRTVKGQSGTLEFIEYEEEKHYNLVRDPLTGNLYRQYTHTTREEVSKVAVEFEDDAVTAIEEIENNGPGETVTIPAPFPFFW